MGAASLACAVLAGVMTLLLRPRPEPVRFRFTDITTSAGISFRHTTGGCGDRWFPEMFSSGCGFFDYDGDGWLDLFLVDGAPLPGCADPDRRHGPRLYRNRGDATFEDVTAAAGIADPGYGFGVCAGDYDNDGAIDLYVTHLSGNRLYRNLGNGTFSDVTAAAGVACGRFSTSCAFGDYDRDGYLDLYVCNYTVYSQALDLQCRPHRDVPTYCHPIEFTAQQDTLYHNNRDGTFTDVSRAAGIEVAEPGKALGVAWTDFDHDGDPDLFVANDLDPNLLFRNNGAGSFTEVAREAGVAVASSGKVQAGMGVAVGDVNRDGAFELFVTNFANEPNTLYLNNGHGRFTDATDRAGLGAVSVPFLGFGAVFADLDLDGDPDLCVANGHVWDDVGVWQYGLTYEQRALLFQNEGPGRFREVGGRVGGYFARPRVGRGLAVGDLNNDGAPDLLFSNAGQPPGLLRNDLAPRPHWLQLRLTGTRSNRSAVGARVEIDAGGRRQVDEVRSGTSYCSQNSLWLTFGLGSSRAADRVSVRWPSGAVESFGPVTADGIYTLREGDGPPRPWRPAQRSPRSP
jgi:hypothetical protein